MKLLITGLNGTLAPHVAHAAVAAGVDVVGWSRAKVNPDDPVDCQAWLDSERPDAIAHLATGSTDWASLLAGYAAERGMPFVFTSTAMVFHHDPDGPHAADSQRNAQDPYGKYKIACEDAILAAYPGASVVRIGWQIDPQQFGNNMLMALDSWQARDGCVAVSRAWRPACSFMTDTAAALVELLTHPRHGVVHLDSNADESHSFDQIVAAMKQTFARDEWVLRVHEDYRHDQRLVGGAELLPPLSARLPLIR